MKYKHQIALSFIFVTSLIVGAFSLVIYFSVEQHTKQQFKTRLEERAILAAQVRLEKDELSTSKYNEIVNQQLKKLDKEEYYFLDVNQLHTAESKLPNKLYFPEIYNKEKQHLDVFFTEKENQLSVHLFYEDNQGDYFVVLTAKDVDGEEDLAFVQQILIIMFVATLLAIGVLALFFAQQILSPVKKITRQMKQITASKINTRLQLKENQDQLYDLSLTFNKMLDRLQDSFEYQKQFIHNASHEIRTPLTVILGEADFALSSPSISTETQKVLLKIQAQGERLKKMLEGLLQLSQLETEKIDLNFKAFRFDEVFHQCIEEIHTYNPNAKIQLKYAEQEMDEKYMLCYGNPIWTEIAIHNLLSNALKFSSNKKVVIHFNEDASFVKASVEDQGIGIEQKELSQITKAFYRGENAHFANGSGIGLSLVNKIIQLQKGKLKIDSTPHRGTKVFIELPKHKR